MRTPHFDADALLSLFRRRQVVTMDQMRAALGTAVDRTVFRKLQEFPYHSSYSHRGKFYTLRELAAFDARGLFQVGEARFSRFGSLLETAEHFVAQSAAGYFTAELNPELEVETKEALLTLTRRGRVVREEVQGLYLHCAPEAERRADQLRHREQGVDLPGQAPPTREMKIGDEAKAALLLFFATLNEHQRRLYAGVESLRLGYGGDRRIAELTGLNVHTVARGRHELLAAELEEEGIRRGGGGRVAVEKKRPR